MAAIQTEDSCKGLSPPQSKAPLDAGATVILGFFLVLGLGALLIVAAWR